MLRGIHPRPDFLSHLANELLHVMIPFSGLVSWLCFDPHPRLTIKVLCYAAIAPLIYVIYMFAAGSITGYYQYPIFNINQLGVVQPLITALVISVFFIGLSVIFYKIDQHLGINQQR